MRDRVRDHVNDQARDQVWDQVWEQVRKQVRDHVLKIIPDLQKEESQLGYPLELREKSRR